MYAIHDLAHIYTELKNQDCGYTVNRRWARPPALVDSETIVKN